MYCLFGNCSGMEKMDKHQNRGGSASNKDFCFLLFLSHIVPYYRALDWKVKNKLKPSLLFCDIKWKMNQTE